jgi:hypothetical protein
LLTNPISLISRQLNLDRRDLSTDCPLLLPCQISCPTGTRAPSLLDVAAEKNFNMLLASVSKADPAEMQAEVLSEPSPRDSDKAVQVGAMVEKKLGRDVLKGTVVSVHEDYYHVLFEDGDEQDFEESEILKLQKQMQRRARKIAKGKLESKAAHPVSLGTAIRHSVSIGVLAAEVAGNAATAARGAATAASDAVAGVQPYLTDISSGQLPAPRIGTVVLVNFEDKRWYRGTVAACETNDAGSSSLSIVYDDGDVEACTYPDGCGDVQVVPYFNVVKSCDDEVELAPEYTRRLSKHAQDKQVRDQLLSWHLSNLEYGCAAPLNKISSLYWDQDDQFGHDGHHAMLRSGFSQIVQNLAHGVACNCNTVSAQGQGGLEQDQEQDDKQDQPQEATACCNSILLGSQVTRIKYCARERVNLEIKRTPADTDDCKTEQAVSSVAADYCIVALPLGVLKSKEVAFEPALPLWKSSAIDRLGSGNVHKVLMKIASPFWDESEFTANSFFGRLDIPSEQLQACVGDIRIPKRGVCFMFWVIQTSLYEPGELEESEESGTDGPEAETEASMDDHALPQRPAILAAVSSGEAANFMESIGEAKVHQHAAPVEAKMLTRCSFRRHRI